MSGRGVLRGFGNVWPLDRWKAGGFGHRMCRARRSGHHCLCGHERSRTSSQRHAPAVRPRLHRAGHRPRDRHHLGGPMRRHADAAGRPERSRQIVRRAGFLTLRLAKRSLPAHVTWKPRGSVSSGRANKPSRCGCARLRTQRHSGLWKAEAETQNGPRKGPFAVPSDGEAQRANLRVAMKRWSHWKMSPLQKFVVPLEMSVSQ